MKNKTLIAIPIIVCLLLCVSEWVLWKNVPYAFFHSRGHTDSNLDYNAVTRGDLVASNIFVTPDPRLCRYVTDKNGARNEILPAKADILIYGDSFAWGAGNSHEDTVAVQLKRLMGREVVLASGTNLPFKTTMPMEIAATLIKQDLPVPAKVFLYFILDVDLLEPVWPNDPVGAIDHIFETKELPQFSWQERFNNFKNHIRDYSPHAILARKLKTKFDKALSSFLRDRGVLTRQNSRSLDYLERNGVVSGFMKISPNVSSFNNQNQKLSQVVRGFERLYHHAKEKGITFIPVIVPRKEIAYNRYLNNGVHIHGYGPGEVLYEALSEQGIKSIFLHPALFDAVRQEVEEGKMFVYWRDDTHWSGYGIAIAAKEIKKFLMTNRF